MVLGYGIAVTGGGVTLFPRQHLLCLLILHTVQDVNIAFAQGFAATQTGVLCQQGIILQRMNREKKGDLASDQNRTEHL